MTAMIGEQGGIADVKQESRPDSCLRVATVTLDRFQKERQRVSIPVPVDEIAEWLGFRIVLLTTVPDDFSGLVSLEDRLIGVNRNHHNHRRRFSIAHEIAHVLLGHPAEGISFRKEIRLYDQEADICASELLIPGTILLPVLERTRNIRVLASTFLVSPEAMERRLQRIIRVWGTDLQGRPKAP
jgi:Zn-dependent peptidase ImmA (M78 family)